MNPEETFQKIYNLIKTSQNILLIAHRRPDGDALGALCAFFRFVKSAEKSVTAYCADYPNKIFDFLDGFREIKFNEGLSDFNQFDLIICLDCGDLEQTGCKDKLILIQKNTVIINIDHHLTNTYFGQVNLVEAKASSTSEIITEFFNFLKIEIGKEQAACLLVGILADTDNFSNSATIPKTLRLAAGLLAKGINFKKLNSFDEKNKNLSILKLWGEILSRLEKNNVYNIATTVITKEDFKRYNIKEEALNNIANFFNNLAGVKATLILKEDGNGRIRGSLRTTDEEVDVANLAQVLGGGGHKKAAGFSLAGKLTRAGEHWQVK